MCLARKWIQIKTYRGNTGAGETNGMNQKGSCRSQTAQASSAGWDLICGSSHSLRHVSLGDQVYITTLSTAAKHTEVVECIVAPIRALVGCCRRRLG